MAEERGRIRKRQNVSLLPSSIGVSDVATSISITAIVSATPTGPVTESLFTLSNGSTRTSIIINPNAPTTGVSSSAAQASETHTSTASKASSTSTAGASKAPDNLNILIPAIVAPVAAFLVISFVAFWLFMRRRQKKAMENEPEFVMEGMKEKPQSRPITADSNSSTRELVPYKTKEAAIDVKEVDRSVTNNLVATSEKDFAFPRLEPAMGSRPGSRQTDQTGRTKQVPNFSRGPRPNTAGRDAAPSPAPPFTQHERDNSGNGYRPSTDASGPRPMNGPTNSNRGDPLPRPNYRPGQPRTGSFSRPLGPPHAMNRGAPAPIYTKPGRPSQEGHTQVPTGAYNGSSPISQYSPIVKEMPKFGTSPMATVQNAQSRAPGGSISSINDQGIRKPPPTAIKTGNSPMSPADPNFSQENMRIAQLGNSSRLGLQSVIATTAATSPATEEPPTPSPRLPPPATRDAPPINYNIPLPTHEPPAPASIQARLNGASITDRRSVVSGLSDDYVDMEVDNKSDVSSLDEREKWQMENDNEKANSQQAGLGGYGGFGPRPPLLDSRHDSSASGSQYSLGYYTKDSTRDHSR